MKSGKDKEEKILFVINPDAGTGMQKNLVTEIKELSEKYPFEYHILLTSGDQDPDRIQSSLDEFQPSITVAAGGDGTVNLVARQVLGHEIKLGIIPMGSSNGLAYQLNIPENPVDALKVVISGKARRIDLLEINGKHICLHLSDLGMNARVIRRYEDEGIRGLYGYARQYFKELGRTKRFRCILHTDGRHLTARVVMIVLANASYYGTGAYINPQGKLDDGRFEIILIESYPFWFLLSMLTTLITGKRGKQRFIRTISCREAKVSVFPPQDMQVDGEPFGSAETITAKILPDKMNVITTDAKSS